MTNLSNATASTVSKSHTDVVIRLAGESGEGVVSLGDLLVRVLTLMGLDLHTFQTFPAEIKGGTVMYQIRASDGVTLSQGDAVDIFVALNHDGFALFGKGMREDGILLYDSDVFTPPTETGRTELSLPISTFATNEKNAVRHLVEPEQLKRLPPPKNIVGLGALLALIHAPMEPAERYVRELFARKGEHIVGMNISALHSGTEHIRQQVASAGARLPHLQPRENRYARLTINGNQMAALGALAGGLQFYAGYPITPATEIMEALAKDLPANGGSLIQAEDEIAALGMCLGASYGGARTMTASSGPGISLMTEQINLAGQSELPVVIIDVQRGGASTGMPTKTSQGDLNLACYGVHNESPRIVIAPCSVSDCFWTSIDALNLADEFQCPVIVLSDQALATRKRTVGLPDTSKVEIRGRVTAEAESILRDGYLRYRDTDTGISPMTIPGMPGGQYVNTGIEHDEAGDPGYTPELAAQAKAKRFRKMDTCRARYGASFIRVYQGAQETSLSAFDPADVGVIAFGSTEGVVREAMQRAQREGYSVAHLHLRMLMPLPVAQIEEFAAKCKRLLVVELNYSGQLANWLRAHIDMKLEELHKDEGVPFIPNEIYQRVTQLAGTEEKLV